MAEIMLSEAGMVRREAMRAMLSGAVVRRRRRRRAVRVAAVLLLCAGGAWLALPRRIGPQPQPVAASASPLPHVQFLRDDPTVLARLSCANEVRTVQYLDDASLLAELQRDGRPAGLVRRAGRVEVLPRIDDEWQAAQ